MTNESPHILQFPGIAKKELAPPPVHTEGVDALTAVLNASMECGQEMATLLMDFNGFRQRNRIPKGTTYHSTRSGMTAVPISELATLLKQDSKEWQQHPQYFAAIADALWANIRRVLEPKIEAVAELLAMDTDSTPEQSGPLRLSVFCGDERDE